MTHEFKIGDAVFLKSGGACMTVSHVEGDKVDCIYHNDNGDFIELFEIKAACLSTEAEMRKQREEREARALGGLEGLMEGLRQAAEDLESSLQ